MKKKIGLALATAALMATSAFAQDTGGTCPGYPPVYDNSYAFFASFAALVLENGWVMLVAL